MEDPADHSHCSKPQSPAPFKAIPAELVDIIFDFLHNDKKSLAACSLTSRDFSHSASYHLFYTLTVSIRLDYIDGKAQIKAPEVNPFEDFRTFLYSFQRKAFIRELTLNGCFQPHPLCTTRNSNDIEYAAAGFGDFDPATLMSTPFLFDLLLQLPSLQYLKIAKIDFYYKERFDGESIPALATMLGSLDLTRGSWRSDPTSRRPPLENLWVDTMDMGNDLRPLMDILRMFTAIDDLQLTRLLWRDATPLSPEQLETIFDNLPLHLNLGALTIGDFCSHVDILLKLFQKTPSIHSITSLSVSWNHCDQLIVLGEMLEAVGPHLVDLTLVTRNLPPPTEFARYGPSGVLEQLNLSRCTVLESFEVSAPMEGDEAPESMQYLISVISQLPPSIYHLEICLGIPYGLSCERLHCVDWKKLDWMLCALEELDEVVVVREIYTSRDREFRRLDKDLTELFMDRLIGVTSKELLSFEC